MRLLALPQPTPCAVRELHLSLVVVSVTNSWTLEPSGRSEAAMPYTAMPQRHYAARRTERRQEGRFAEDRRLEHPDLRASSHNHTDDAGRHRQDSDHSAETLFSSDSETVGRSHGGVPREDTQSPRRPSDVHYGTHGRPRHRAGYRRNSDENTPSHRGDYRRTIDERRMRTSTYDDDDDDDDENEDEDEGGRNQSYFYDVISRFMGDSSRGPMRRAESTDSTGEPLPMTRERARDDGTDTAVSLSRIHSIPRAMSGMSYDSDRSLGDPESLDPNDPADEDGDWSKEKEKNERGLAQTAEEAEMIASMTYMQRRKYLSRAKIVFNTTSA